MQKKAQFQINSLSKVALDVFKLDISGAICYVRLFYCKSICEDDFFAGGVLSSEKADEIVFASQCFAAEAQAKKYLARQEHCAFLLSQKLAKKGHSDEAISAALRYLKSVNFLSDSRFARAWIQNRFIVKKEGRARLLAELLKRGVSTEDANFALDDFFSENDEREILQGEAEKLQKKGLPPEKIFSSLLKKGFKFAEIRQFVDAKLCED